MPPQDDTKRPVPSAVEINAYLELSAARTKKRLTLAFVTPGATKNPVRDRKLPVAGAPKSEMPQRSPLPGLKAGVTGSVEDKTSGS